MMPPADPRWRLNAAESDRPVIELVGAWQLTSGVPAVAQVIAQMQALELKAEVIPVDGSAIVSWDSSLPAFVLALERAAKPLGIQIERRALPAGVMRLLALTRPAAEGSGKQAAQASSLEALGQWVWARWLRVLAWSSLAGLTFMASLRLLTGRAKVPLKDLFDQIIECGPSALPIVTLLAFLIGGITAFVGVIQLRMFGAELYVADLVGMAMLLEMGALMTAIIMAGRAGAAFAAALGTMQTNEEVDALQTLGFDPVEFLVMPRVLALTLMTPLLTLYADFMGIMGGAVVGILLLDMSPAIYFTETASAVHLSDAVKGLLKSLAFGALIGFAGCLRGIECGRSALAVGRATTSAVVTSIVLIVLADAFITVLYFVYDGVL
jgi:phospholipid/cholesterol/gamma-HCH transport system permease protein